MVVQNSKVDFLNLFAKKSQVQSWDIIWHALTLWLGFINRLKKQDFSKVLH
jgi:hypothetical protein